MQPVILCGGNGTRLWPLSRKLYPKQFIEIAEGRVLFSETLMRCADMEEAADPIVVCTDEHRFLAAVQMRKHGVSGRLVLEPVGRNTAPAAGVAAIMSSAGDPTLLVMPADHNIINVPDFQLAIMAGLARAESGAFVCFGIVPDQPHTDYGYIRRGAEAERGVYKVDEFVEKPDAERARQFIESGEYFWNSGIFMFKASSYLEALGRFAPEILDCCARAVEGSYRDIDFIRLEAEAFNACPSDSIDYAVMEKVKDIEVVPMDIGWSDLGSWNALYEINEKDEHGNSVIGDVLTEDSHDCYLRASDRLLVGLGLESMAVIETSDAILVAPRARLGDLKVVVKRMEELGRPELYAHKIVYRPWGSFECISAGDRFQVKRIIVKPGETLSVQKHYHRAEHWVVVKGTASVTNCSEQVVLREDQSTYISLGSVHSLGNPGKIDLELIEVQTGSYLGEDDIVRIDDPYKR